MMLWKIIPVLVILTFVLFVSAQGIDYILVRDKSGNIENPALGEYKPRLYAGNAYKFSLIVSESRLSSLNEVNFTFLLNGKDVKSEAFPTEQICIQFATGRRECQASLYNIPTSGTGMLEIKTNILSEIFEIRLDPKETVNPPGVQVIVTPSPEPSPAQVSPIIETAQLCADSDGGKVYTKIGHIDMRIGPETIINYTDFCFINTSIQDRVVFTNILNEYYCDNVGAPKSKEYDCSKEGKICDVGRCVPKEEPLGAVELAVDEQIFGPKTTESPYGRGLNKELNEESYFVDKTVTDYDPLICTFKLDRMIETDKIKFKVFDSLGEVIEKEPICKIDKCDLKIEPHTFDRTISTASFNPINPQTNSVVCEVTYKGKTVKSESLYIPNHLYVFVQLVPPYVTNTKDQFAYFLARTWLDKKSAKPIYRKDGDCDTTKKTELEEIRKELKSKLEHLREKYNNLTSELEKSIVQGTINLIESIIKEPIDDLLNKDPILVSLEVTEKCAVDSKEMWNEKYDRVIGLTNNKDALKRSGGGWTIPGRKSIISDSIMYAPAHELDHTYGLCDEYKLDQYSSQRSDFGCVNKYPSCCLDNFNNPSIEEVRSGLLSCEANSGVCYSSKSCTGYQKKLEDSGIVTDVYELPRASEDCKEYPNATCCITAGNLRKLGNNCYPPSDQTAQQGQVDMIYCAGMPLTVEGRPTVDLSTPWRSVMGSYSMSDYMLNPEGATYPLKAGAPRAG